IDAVLLAGRLLHTPDSALSDALEDVFRRSAHTPGVRETALRCLLLRREAQLPDTLLHTALDYARRAGVKDEVLTAAAQLTEHPQKRRQVLGTPVPVLPGLRFCPDNQPVRVDPGAQLDTNAAQLRSARDDQIVTHLLDGAGAADVAQDLRISERTVHTHVRNVYRKLGVVSRTQLRARLFSQGAPL